MERDHLEGLRVDGRILFKMNLEERGWDGLVCFVLAQGKEKRPAVVNTILKLRLS